MVRPNVDVPRTLHGQFKDICDASDLTLDEAYYEAIKRGLPALCADLAAQDALDADPRTEPILASIVAVAGDGRADHDAPTGAEVSTMLTGERDAQREPDDHDRDGDRTVAEQP